MTGFPSLKGELSPRDKLKRQSRTSLTDEEVEANSRKIGQQWDIPATQAPETKVETPAPIVSIRGYIPEYLDRDLAIKAAQQRVTKTFLIMDALAKAGYRIEDIDMNQDRRRNKP